MEATGVKDWLQTTYDRIASFVHPFHSIGTRCVLLRYCLQSQEISNQKYLTGEVL